jgi:hypothetical protein
MINSDKINYNLIAMDIVDGIDGNFYAVDINGLISMNPIIQYTDEFNYKLQKIFGKDFYFNCPDVIKDSDKVNIGSLNKNSQVYINNFRFNYENKLIWRKKIEVNCPKIGTNIVFHENPDYPKILFKPENGWRAKGIKLYNNNNIIENKQSTFDTLNQARRECKAFNKEMFIEEFIPSKTIDSYCYTTRVLMITNNRETHPLLFLNRKCANPIIKNLKFGRLSNEDCLSYLSNVSDINKKFYPNEDYKLREFVKKINL